MNNVLLVALLAVLPAATHAAEQAPTGHGTMHTGHAAMMAGDGEANESGPSEGGQSAFAAIQEIVAIMEADPATDWRKADIEGLRQHLIDMDNVTLRARVAETATDGEVVFTAIGNRPEVVASIRRMLPAHAATMSGTGNWTLSAREVEGGAELAVRPDRPEDIAKIRGLGLIGVMTVGAHHQSHHLRIATGSPPH